MTRSYENLPGLSGYYLQDSYVLGISQTESSLAFRLELVLREEHPDYRPPGPNEQYCYRRGWLVFEDFGEVRWHRRSTSGGSTDASGEVDYGNIDAFGYGGTVDPSTSGSPSVEPPSVEPPSVEPPSGEASDHGGETYRLEGDWGEVEIIGGGYRVTLARSFSEM